MGKQTFLDALVALAKEHGVKEIYVTTDETVLVKYWDGQEDEFTYLRIEKP